MSRSFTGKDVYDWKVVTRSGAELIVTDGKPKRFTGYADAAAAASRYADGVAVRA